MSSRLVDEVRSALAELADPERAPKMQAYMKSALPFYGVPVPQVRRACRSIFTATPPRSREEWESTVRALFDDARHREEWYAGLALCGHPSALAYQTPDSLDLYRYLARTSAWWDVVDEVAHRVGDVLRQHRTAVTPAMRAWSGAEDMWVRRVAILCQLQHKHDTDAVLLADAVLVNSADGAFFIRKAIGWALRDYARTAPRWVWDFVEGHRSSLAPLSIREALKHLPERP